jgi:hypothetical protein
MNKIYIYIVSQFIILWIHSFVMFSSVEFGYMPLPSLHRRFKDQIKGNAKDESLILPSSPFFP